MKKVLPILLIALISCFAVSAQEATPTQELLMKQIEDIKKEVEKVEKKIGKEEKSIKDAEKSIKESELGKEQTISEKEAKQLEIDEVKSEMEGFNLAGLEDKVKTLESEKKKLESASERNDKSVAKKRGQIETLHAEISALEDENKRNYAAVEAKNLELKDTNNEITSNGLVEKEAALKTKKGELDKITKTEERYATSITKESATIEKAKISLGTFNQELESQKDLLKQKQMQLSTSE